MSVQEIEDSIAGLSLLEAAELVQRLERRLGVSAALPTAQLQPGQQVIFPKEKLLADEAQTEFSVILKAVGPAKINVIKAVREVTSLGLKEAKDAVESLPHTILTGLSKEKAEAIGQKFIDCGASIEYGV
jgi:large subunit ribosomal protein L7/L12